MVEKTHVKIQEIGGRAKLRFMNSSNISRWLSVRLGSVNPASDAKSTKNDAVVALPGPCSWLRQQMATRKVLITVVSPKASVKLQS